MFSQIRMKIEDVGLNSVKFFLSSIYSFRGKLCSPDSSDKHESSWRNIILRGKPLSILQLHSTQQQLVSIVLVIVLVNYYQNLMYHKNLLLFFQCFHDDSFSPWYNFSAVAASISRINWPNWSVELRNNKINYR